MTKRNASLRAIAVLAAVWTVVWLVAHYEGKRLITAARVAHEISHINLPDMSAPQPVPLRAEAENLRREAEVVRIADMITRLDYTEREKNQNSRTVLDFFGKLSPRERQIFVDITITKSLQRFMEALDKLPKEQRQKFVTQGLKALREGKTQEQLARLNALSINLTERLEKEGMRAYLDHASAETKLDLEPLMHHVKDFMEGLRGNDMGFKK